MDYVFVRVRGRVASGVYLGSSSAPTCNDLGGSDRSYQLITPMGIDAMVLVEDTLFGHNRRYCYGEHGRIFQ